MDINYEKLFVPILKDRKLNDIDFRVLVYMSTMIMNNNFEPVQVTTINIGKVLGDVPLTQISTSKLKLMNMQYILKHGDSKYTKYTLSDKIMKKIMN